MASKSLSRRDFLKLAALGAGAVALKGCGFIPSVPAADLPATATPGMTPSPLSPALSLDLTAERTTVPILPGAETPVWRYQATARQGAAEALQVLENSYLGPIFRVKRGQRIQVKLKNELSDPTIIHWHGLLIPEEMDGHPRYAIAPGATYDYDFTVLNRAGTYWFHPHPHGLTGPQVYFGLAGLFIVSDEEEAALGLPSGEYDLPLVIQDRLFDSNNRLVYMTSMMEQVTGFVGDTILVNGQPNAWFDVKASAYRLRLLNGSNSRIYKLAWDNNSPLTVIATDGGLLESPVTRDYVMLAPGERVELWADFSDLGDTRIVSLPFDAGVSGGGMMGGGMMGGASGLPNGARLEIAEFRVGAAGEKSLLLPQHLSNIARYKTQDAANRNRPRSFSLVMQGMTHTINGRVFEMDAVAKDEIVRLGDLEIWEFINREGRMGMGSMMNMEMPHPMHIHGVQFQVFERQAADNVKRQYEQVSAGFVDEGWKDTVLVMPGERVRLLVRFDDFAGMYLYHCHNLEHEDAGMMRNYRVDG